MLSAARLRRMLEQNQMPSQFLDEVLAEKQRRSYFFSLPRTVISTRFPELREEQKVSGQLLNSVNIRVNVKFQPFHYTSAGLQM